MQVLVIGTTEGVVLAQPEAAARPTNLAHHDVRVLRAVGDALFAGARDGLFRSRDGGQSWQLVGLQGKDVRDVAGSPHDPRLIFAGLAPAALFRSDDGGDSWSEVDAFLNASGAEGWCLPPRPDGTQRPGEAYAHALLFDLANPRRCLVGIEVGGLAVSEDGGASWATVVPGGDPDVHAVVQDPGNPDNLYVSGGFGRITNDEPREQRAAGMFGSHDGGRTWRSLWDDMNRQYTRPLCIDPRPPYALTVGSTPSAAPYVTYGQGTQGWVYQSTDQGQTWRSLGDQDHSPSKAAPVCVTPAPDGAGHVLVGTDLGEVWHVSPDCRWTLLARDLAPVQSVVSLGRG